jgi:hypothetical protein
MRAIRLDGHQDQPERENGEDEVITYDGPDE